YAYILTNNQVALRSWVDSVVAHMNASTIANVDVRAFDFALRGALKNACDLFGYDARNVFNSGMVDGAGMGGFNAITFVNNHDYRDTLQPVLNDPMLAYAYILTNNQVGMPCVFYPEYFGVQPPNYPNVNLKEEIDELMGVHSAYIFGSTHRDYLSRFSTPYTQTFTSGYPSTTLIFQLAGGAAGKDVLVCINFAGEPLNVTHGVNADLDGMGGNNFNVGDHFLDLTGNATTAEVTVGSGFTVNVQIPARSYAVFAECDLDTFYEDGDGDDFGDATSTTSACVAPTGYVSDNSDCDDSNAAIHPGATETCNYEDDDCDMQVDEGVQNTFYADADDDNYGDAGSSTLDCTAPNGYVSNSTDCNDGNAAIHPGAAETCNSLDDDCDLLIDETLFATLTSPLNGATNVPVTADLTWSAAAENPLGYRLDVGTTPGGTQILDNFDVGNVLTYNPPGDFPYNATIYVQIKPYYSGGGSNGCGEESFMTKVCIPNLTLENLTIPSGTYRSEGTLISNLATVANGSNVVFKSDTGVSLEHDFTVELGGLLEALIEACPN
ncbi:MAG: MopE-related protein, partial [Bacteroidota bacterium]